MTTPTSGSHPDAQKQKRKKWPWVVGILAILLIIGLCAPKHDDDPKPAASAPTATSTPASTRQEPSAAQSPATSSEPITAEAPKGDPQAWAEERWRSQNCAAKSIRHGGPIFCDVTGTDSEDDGRTLVFHFDGGNDAVKDHFDSMKSRRQMTADSFAELVRSAQLGGDQRVAGVQRVKIRMDGGLIGSWDSEAELPR